MQWIYKDEVYNPEEIDRKEVYGFVYQIECMETGRKYIGKKFFWARKTRQVKLKKKKYLGESDWRNYWGSSDRLQEEINKNKDGFTRTILRLCKTKSECAYYEAKYQFECDCLLREDYFNDWIAVKVTRRHLKK
jgi:hypothetical protein